MSEWPKNDLTEVLAVFEAAALEVLGDIDIWAEEARRERWAPLPWPVALQEEGYPRLLQAFVLGIVENVLGDMRATGWIPPDPSTPESWEFQVLLRVVKRAVDAGDLAMRKHSGGMGRLSGKRELENYFKREAVDAAIRSGLPRAQAFRDLGMSKASAYRAMKRNRPKKSGG